MIKSVRYHSDSSANHSDFGGVTQGILEFLPLKFEVTQNQSKQLYSKGKSKLEGYQYAYFAPKAA